MSITFDAFLIIGDELVVIYAEVTRNLKARVEFIFYRVNFFTINFVGSEITNGAGSFCGRAVKG